MSSIFSSVFVILTYIPIFGIGLSIASLGHDFPLVPFIGLLKSGYFCYRVNKFFKDSANYSNIKADFFLTSKE